MMDGLDIHALRQALAATAQDDTLPAPTYVEESDATEDFNPEEDV